MHESLRTAGFAVVAAAALLFAWWAAPTSATRPPERQDYKVGQEFFPEFKNPNEATSLRVVTYDEGQRRPREFKVEFRNGLWTIPTHHNYPADAQTRLGKTAASLLGVKREELRSIEAADQAEFGVLDPLDGSESGKKGMGQRLTLAKGDETLLDLIVGKPVKGRTGYYYVRRSDEKGPTYIAKLDNVDFSTRFSDWIETDLLKIAGDDLTGVVMNNYSVDDLGRPLRGDLNELSRDKSADPWILKGINADKEEVDTGKTSQMVDALDNLKLVGVRPKPKGLSQTLKVAKEASLSREDVADLDDKGFQLTQGDLFAKYGEFTAITNKGAIYTLRFGDTDFGSEEQVESGLEKGKPVPANKDKKKKDEKPAAGSAQPPRYLFVTVQFDEKYVGPKPPVKPTAPVRPQPPAKPPEVKPTETKPAEKAGEKTADKPGEKAAEKTATKPGDKPADKPAEKDKPAAKPEPAAKPDPAIAAAEAKYQGELQKYLTDKDKYDEDLKKFEEETKAHEKKIEEGRSLVKELNDRFADWYYVIPGEAYAQLRVSRKDLIKAKKPAEDVKPGQSPADLKPGFPGGDKPEIRPQKKTETPAGNKPEEKPAAKPVETPTEKPAPKGGDKPADNAPDKVGEKTPPAGSATTTAKPTEKPVVKTPAVPEKPVTPSPEKK